MRYHKLDENLIQPYEVLNELVLNLDKVIKLSKNEIDGILILIDEALYKKLVVLRTHGITKENMKFDFPEPEKQGLWYYEMQELGYKLPHNGYTGSIG